MSAPDSERGGARERPARRRPPPHAPAARAVAGGRLGVVTERRSARFALLKVTTTWVVAWWLASINPFMDGYVCLWYSPRPRTTGAPSAYSGTASHEYRNIMMFMILQYYNIMMLKD